jgi:hypothetical protein
LEIILQHLVYRCQNRHLLLQQVAFDAPLQRIICCRQLITRGFKRLDLRRIG